MRHEHGVAFQFEGDVSDFVLNFPTGQKVGEQPTTQCGHCGKHFPMPRFDRGPRGTGKIRGMCFACNSKGVYVCGPDCPGVCGGQEKMLDILEGVLNPTAVSVSVPKSKIWLPAA